MKNILLILIILLANYSLSAQNAYKAGHIFLHNGDTLPGQINKRTVNRNPDEITFRSTEAAAPSVYHPAEILGFEMDGQMSALVEVYAEKAFPLPSGPELITATDTVFLEILVDGEKSLAAFRDKDDIRNYYIGSRTNYTLLKYKKYMKTTADDKNFLTEITVYRDQLKNYLGTCPEISRKADRVGYNADHLLKLFETYYACTNSMAGFAKPIQKVGPEFGILLGVSNTRAAFAGDNVWSAIDFPSSTGITGGMFINFILPANLKKFSINNEVLYHSYKTEGDIRYIDANYSAYEYYEYHKLGAQYIKFNSMLRFKTPVGAASIFMNAGLSYGFAISKTNYSRKETTRFGVPAESFEGPSLSEFRTTEKGYNIGAGIAMRKLQFELRMDKSDGMISNLGLKSNISRYSLLAAYKL